ncbi:MAG: hypothetical protein M3R29_05315 [Verrucomicrobiota bacterium]|nr:hypothetical protein [Verrucomicrobiota bacterium]
MTPQANFMILAPIKQGREEELTRLLESMNDAPGQLNVNNPLIPFAQLDSLHFARLLILKDNTLNDVRAYGGGPAPTYPLYLAFLGDIDGDVDNFFEELVRRAGDGLRKIFSYCDGFKPTTELVRWMKAQSAPPIAAYVNWRGRTVLQIREEAALQEALQKYLRDTATVLENLPARKIHARLQEFVEKEKAEHRLKLSHEKATPVWWWIKNSLHLIGPLLLLSVILLLLRLIVPLLFLPLIFLLLSLVVVIALIYVTLLRRLEKTDPELCWRVDQKYSDMLSSAEDHYVTNQFTAMGSLKPGLVRLLTIIGVLVTVNWAARHITPRGHLGRIRTIHFARWVFLDGKKRMVFFSNYDGTVESYMDDFINKTGFGLNAVFSNGIGYPRTNWLVLDGCQDEQKYKDFLRRHTLPTQVWYKAYLGLTAIDLERNTRIRQGLESASMSDQEARKWAALL